MLPTESSLPRSRAPAGSGGLRALANPAASSPPPSADPPASSPPAAVGASFSVARATSVGDGNSAEGVPPSSSGAAPAPSAEAPAPTSAGTAPPTSAGLAPPTLAGMAPPTSSGAAPPTSANGTPASPSLAPEDLEPGAASVRLFVPGFVEPVAWAKGQKPLAKNFIAEVLRRAPHEKCSNWKIPIAKQFLLEDAVRAAASCSRA
mmetsp:Transcript_18252/g.46030  ORF Transcript_18252/g.46030 Transcript_18252/m.46030 type:complete len:205 (+) Transcript_18252:196-810(+)